MKRLWWCSVSPLVVALLLGGAASAQQAPALGERPPLPNASDGPRPDQGPDDPDSTPDPQVDSPLPPKKSVWKTGQYQMSLGATLATIFDDNIYALSSNKISDTIFVVRPEAGLDLRGDNYASSARVAVENRTYSRNSGESQINGSASIGTTVQPSGDFQIKSRLGYARAHEQRGAAESIYLSFDKPVQLDQYDGAIVFNKRFGRWWTSLGGARTWYHYTDPTILGIPIDQSYRNGNVNVGTGRVGVVVAPLTSVFAEVSGNARNFEVDSFDSRGFRVVGGMLFEPGPGARVKGEFFAGYMEQDYSGATFQAIRTITYGGLMAFKLDPQMTLTFDGRREAKESALNGGVSVLESVVSGRLDFHITSKLTVGVGVSYLNQTFYGASRIDQTWGPLASIKYAFTPNIAAGIEYRYIGFDSSGLGTNSYSRNAVMFTLAGRI
ncbi:MAG: outer membrane beta-barrel protein [Pseudolabrys sp.]